jgi:hypothetical protein
MVMCLNTQKILESRLHVFSSPWLSSGENHPAIESSRPLFAASAGLDAEIGGCPFDHIAKPDLLVRDKSRQAHSVRRECVLV